MHVFLKLTRFVQSKVHIFIDIDDFIPYSLYVETMEIHTALNANLDNIRAEYKKKLSLSNTNHVQVIAVAVYPKVTWQVDKCWQNIFCLYCSTCQVAFSTKKPICEYVGIPSYVA